MKVITMEVQMAQGFNANTLAPVQTINHYQAFMAIPCCWNMARELKSLGINVKDGDVYLVSDSGMHDVKYCPFCGTQVSHITKEVTT